MRRRKQKGFVLLTIALSAVALLGACGIAVDVGRMYVIRNELQNFVDTAALAAALRLNGESGGVVRARDEVSLLRTQNSWNLGSRMFQAQDVTVKFAPVTMSGAPGTWTDTPPNPPTNYSFVRVRATVRAPIYFMAAVTGQTSSPVAAVATGGQLPASSPQSYFPFTPLAHERTKPNFGFVKGDEYTLKWASAPKFNGGNVCHGDLAQTWIDLAESRGAENRGYFGDQTSASMMWDQVANDAPVAVVREGDRITLTGGAKSTVKDALTARIGQDADPSSGTFTAYRDRGRSRRIVTVPVTDATAGNEVVGFARFFLKPANNYSNAQGNEPWCGEYIGPGAPEGSDSYGANISAGITKVRLWE